MPNSAQMNRAVDQAANQTVIHGETTSAMARPDYVNDLCANQHADVTIVRDLFAGTGQMRKKSKTYLPQHAKEDDADYERRLKKAVLFNAVKRTAKGLVGMIFAKEPTPKDVPDEIMEHFENIDLGGRALSVFARDLTEDAIIDGHAGIHVEHPPKLRIVTDTGEREASLAEERAAKIRPYWVSVKKSQIINVQWTLVQGEPFLTLVVYTETASEPVGKYGEQHFTRYRVLRPGSFEVWQEEKVDGKMQYRLVDSGTTSLSYIPFVPVYADMTGFFESCPPLLDLAYENIDHYQNQNEHKMSLGRARIPMPFFTGVEQANVKWGANFAIFAEAPGATAEMLESTGAALGASREDIKDTETRMAALGLSMLVRETRSAETAEGKRIDRAESDSQLATIARGVGDGLEMALWMHADYMNLDRDSVGSIEVNQDFADYEIDAQMLGAMLTARSDNRISNETLWSFMQRGKLLPPDFEPEKEKAALDDDEPGDALNAGLAKLRSMQEPEEVDDAAPEEVDDAA